MLAGEVPAAEAEAGGALGVQGPGLQTEFEASLAYMERNSRLKKQTGEQKDTMGSAANGKLREGHQGEASWGWGLNSVWGKGLWRGETGGPGQGCCSRGGGRAKALGPAAQDWH